MKAVIIHGQSHKGSTYNVARMFADSLGAEVKEFFLPRDFGNDCVGCNRCLLTSEEECPHRERILPIIKAMDEADVIVLASPVYVYHVTGAMKSFLDHLAYRWMLHRPNPDMFFKIGVCISTAAGGGLRSANKDMSDSLFFWGTGKIYRYGVHVRSVAWDAVSAEIKARIEKQTRRLAAKVKSRAGKVRPSLKTKIYFGVMRMLHKRLDIAPPDKEYWDGYGWTGENRPWKH